MKILRFAIMVALLGLGGCAGEFDEGYQRYKETRAAVNDRVDAAIVDRVCRKSPATLLELVGGDEALAATITDRCNARVLPVTP